jgi:RNA polymerase sigma factor (sigma-70 family)
VDRRTQRLVLGRIQAGDAAAFSMVYETFRARLYGFLVRMTRHPPVAEELLQETWTKLAKNASRLAEDTELGAWLFTVARNLARDYLRTERGSPLRPDAENEACSDDDPFDQAAANETQARLTKALHALRAEDREVLLFVAVEGMSQDQAARVLGLTHEAARQRLSRARSRLLALLESPLPVQPSTVIHPEDSSHVRH